MADLGKAYVQIMPSAKGISGSITKAIQPEAASAGKAAGNSLFGGMMKVAGGIGITKALSWATGKLTENLSGAVSRYDAIENSKNVFKAMKFSTEEADQVTKYFSETLDGLPTGFDEAIKGTQSFAGATKDLKWSGETWNALNNAVLAFGGTSEQTSRVTDVLTKSFSSGKVDGQAFQSMLANGLGPALQEMATRAGYNNIDELQEAFKNGELSAEDFGEMLQDVSENGSDSLDSLEEVARANTMGIGTAFKLVGSRIVQGLEGVLRSTEETLEKIGLPSIAEMTDTFSKGIRESIKKIGTGIEVLGDFIIEHKELFIGAWESMTESAGLFGDLISDVWLSIQEVFEAIAAPLMEWFIENQESIFETVGIVWDGIKTIFFTVLEIISTVVSGTLGNMVEFINENQEEILSIIDTVWTGIKLVIETAITLVSGIVQSVLALIQGDWQGAWTIMKETVSTIWESIKSTISTLIESVRSVVSEKVEAIRTAISDKFQAAKNAAEMKFIQLKTAVTTKISEAYNNVKDYVSDIVSAFTDIDLFAAGKAVIGGFVKGLKNKWEEGKSFIGGIGGWIAKNKGPISYDRKLLRPAGNAIMQGLDKGLQERFKGVKDTVGGMAGVISDTMTARPTIDVDSSVARSNALLDGTINHQLKDLKLNSKPAYINLNIGGQVFRAFVEDISNEQGKITDLEMQF